MNDDDHLRATDLFLQIVDLDPARRRAALDEACLGNEELRREVESLLAQDDRGLPSILESGSLAPAASPEPEPDPARIGPYSVAEKVGAGGMGVVYRAWQEKPIRRQVAIKLIKVGLETEPLLRRFDSERRALELLDHDGIAQVIDAGVTGHGRPYFVMEYVEGAPINAFCDRARLDVNARLRLFLRVCEAVEHAHQNAVIHRDLKPSNVLVREVSGRPYAKVIDFGIAKILDPESGEVTLTEAGQLMGTPAYMSPEQATLAPGTVDTRTDVYALGAILYELLVGTRPLADPDDGEISLVETCRRIREEEPLSPSRRLAALGSRKQVVAERRSTRPQALDRKLRGDLDCIVLKALEKERSSRYDSVGALAADVRRHLENKPIEARPHGVIYQTGKLMKQHRTASAMVAVLVPLLVVVAAVLAIQTGRIARERDRAEEIADFLVHFYDTPFFVAERHGRPTAEQVLVRSAAKLQALGDRPVLQARLQMQMGTVLSAIGLTDRAEELLDGSHARLAVLVGPEDPLTLAAAHGLAMTRWSRRAPGVESMLLETMATRRRVLGERNPDTLRAMVDVGHFYKRAARFDEALIWLEAAAPGLEAVLGRSHEDAMVASSLLASVLMDVGRFDEAQVLLEDLVPRFVTGSPESYIAAYNLACIHATRGERRPALDYLALAIERGWAAGIRADPTWEAYLDDPEFIALALQCELRYDLVRDEIARAIGAYEKSGEFGRSAELCQAVLTSVPLTPWQRSRWELRLASAYLGLGRYAEAETLVSQRLDYLERTPDTLPEKVDTLWYLVQARLGRGDTSGAVDALDHADGLFVPTPQSRAIRAAIQGDPEAALADLEQAVRHGFAGSYRLRRDLAFRELRATPAFESLLAEMRRRTWVPSDLPLDVFISIRTMPPAETTRDARHEALTASHTASGP